MFKPHYGICVCHGLKRLIVVKKGYCHEGNQNNKGKINRTNSSRWNKANDAVLRRGVRSKDNASGSSEGISKGNESNETISRFSKLVQKGKLFKKAKSIHSRRQPSGELALFQKMWEEAIKISEETYGDDDGPKCTCCPRRLGKNLDIRFFSHLLTKAAYGLFRLLRRNIWIKCPDCHTLWETGSVTDNPNFAAALEEKENLKQLYYDKTVTLITENGETRIL
jgi:hypothetical protein